MATTDPTFVEEFASVLRALLDVHDRECQARREADAGFGTRDAVEAASRATQAALIETAVTLDDRISDAIARLVHVTGLPLSEPRES
jgi:hypothetical protein